MLIVNESKHYLFLQTCCSGLWIQMRVLVVITVVFVSDGACYCVIVVNIYLFWQVLSSNNVNLQITFQSLLVFLFTFPLAVLSSIIFTFEMMISRQWGFFVWKGLSFLSKTLVLVLCKTYQSLVNLNTDVAPFAICHNYSVLYFSP